MTPYAPVVPRCARCGFVITALIIALGVGCGGSKSAETSKNAKTVAVSIEKVELRKVPREIEAVGTVESRLAAQVQSQVAGQVIAVHFEAGDAVETGKLLVELDNRELNANATMAENALAEAESALSEMRTTSAAARANAAAADASQILADSTLKRHQNLYERKAVSLQARDEAEATSRSAGASAVAALETWKSSQSSLERAAATVERARAAVDAARTALSHSKISAPFSGVITAKYVNAGDLATPGKTLLTMDDPKAFRVSALVRESDSPGIQAGASVRVTIGESAPIASSISEVVPSADPASRTFEVRANLPDGVTLRSGMFARVQIVAGETEALTVPAGAVQEHGQLTYVYVVDSETVARLRLVKTGRAIQDRIEILSGLDSGEMIVVTPIDALTDGTPVSAG
jgi:multidrug efflux pump subunit AcrA (membrane-fusion protein)